jgi:hypothetical protein
LDGSILGLLVGLIGITGHSVEAVLGGHGWMFL